MSNVKEPVSERELRSENLANAEAFGVDAQIMQAIEEMAELIQALNKTQRYIFHPKYLDEHKVEEAHYNVMEEIADVEIMTEQLKYLFGISEAEITEIKRHKITRTTERRKAETHDNEKPDFVDVIGKTIGGDIIKRRIYSDGSIYERLAGHD